MAHIIDGKALAEKVKSEVAAKNQELIKKGITPGLAVVLVGTNSASQVYVRNKRASCEKAGIKSFAYDLPEMTSETALLELIGNLNDDPAVHGILVQLPLPKHIDESKIIQAIDPDKDVDGFHPINVGKLSLGQKCLKPCTPSGVMKLIETTGIDLKGKNAVIIGRSNIVGKPMALMLLEKHATVTICHSRTADLPSETRRADVLVAAVGRAKMVKGSWLKKDAIVIDVGMNRDENGKLCGDVDFADAQKIASYITPVPGGVGPMTIAMLLMNTVEAAARAIVR